MDEIRTYIDKFLDFDASTGEFRWNGKGRGWASKTGRLAGSIDSKGYRQISINGKEFLAHRLVWLMVHGELPGSDLDHIDRNSKNNAPSNLRLCTHAQNHQNAKMRVDNSSGTTGVSYIKTSGMWLAYINVDGKRHRLGQFEEKEDAVEARLRAKPKLHTFHPHQK